MDEEKTVIQSKFGVRLKFQFGADQLTYSVRDQSGELQFPIYYEAINVLAPSTIVTNNDRFVRRIFAFPIAAIVASIAMTNFNKAASDGFGLLGGALIVLLLVARALKLFAIRYTMLRMSPPPAGATNHLIRIIQDKNHAAVIEEIKSRWRARIKKLHGDINFANDATKEIAKLTWLKENAVITDGEYREAVEKVQAHAMHNQLQTAERTFN